MKAKPLSLRAWQRKADTYARRALGFAVFAEPGDPYECDIAGRVAFEQQQDPQAFIREVFADDFAGQEYNAYLRAESRRAQ